eukprot:TRINITY_DN17246_c0_g1_i1.p1 TRINITY_DN17246_c0_g1~~TRINITY_DN17246_c0_g1_i1.p1  ORF type:complete len:250 (+),score=42.14 TRINITY_DN17246_c0_g1_i1:154-903(+)
MSSPSILRRRTGTPTTKLPSFQGDVVLPALPKVVQPEEKDVQSIVLSPFRAPTQSRVVEEQRPQPRPCSNGNSEDAIPKRNGSQASTWSGRVFVQFARDEDQEPVPTTSEVQVFCNKRKRESPQAEPHPAEDDDDDTARRQFSSNVSHVLLAMRELRDEEDKLSDDPTSPQVDLVSQLLLEAESSAKQGSGYVGSTKTGDGAVSAVESYVSNDTCSLERVKTHNSPDKPSTNMLETTVQAPVSPGVAIA